MEMTGEVQQVSFDKGHFLLGMQLSKGVRAALGIDVSPGRERAEICSMFQRMFARDVRLTFKENAIIFYFPIDKEQEETQ